MTLSSTTTSNLTAFLFGHLFFFFAAQFISSIDPGRFSIAFLTLKCEWPSRFGGRGRSKAKKSACGTKTWDYVSGK